MGTVPKDVQYRYYLQDVAKARLDHLNALEHAREEGFRCGQMEALHEWKLEVAGRMIDMEFADAEILKITGISVDELNDLHLRPQSMDLE